MSKYNIAEAKTHFSELVQKAMLGEEIIIARDNKAVAKLVPFSQSTRSRSPGTSKGTIWIADDFNETPDDFMGYK